MSAATATTSNPLPNNIVGTNIDQIRAAKDQFDSVSPQEADASAASLLTTAPFDARFPNTNQTRHCWQNYVDFHKCARAKVEAGGAENPGCRKLQRLARIMCPASWIEKWDRALEEGRNPSNMDPPSLKKQQESAH